MRAHRLFPRGAASAALLFSAFVLPPSIAQPGASAAGVPAAAELAVTLDRAALLALAGRLVDAAPRLAKIWPGYWPPEQAFVIYVPGQGALLVSTGEKPQSFQPLTGAGIPDRLKKRVFWHEGDLPEVRRPFVTGYPIGIGKTAILVDATKLGEEKIATLLLHEQFHAYQKDAFKRYAFAQFVDPLAIADRSGFAATAETERRVLAKALASEKPAAAKRLLRQYFALRREREAAMPAEAVRVERGLELVEGTAHFVDLAGLAFLNGGPDGVKPLLADRLQKPIASGAGAFVTQWFRSRSYATGAAITYFVSLLDPGDWRSKLQEGAMPDQLLESLVGTPSPGAAALARKARASMNYPAILREFEPAIRAGEKAELKSVEEFLAGAPYRVILEAEKAGTNGSAGFSANRMVQLGPATIALPEATTFNYSAPSVTLSSSNLPVLMEARERYTVVAASPPEIVGLSATARGEHRLASILIRSAGLELRVDRPVVVSISETSVTVRMADP
ncbi:MAG TPA: hypothetical protein VF548_04175 [Allosphingosinicella sp.]|jgi:hypothetical protein